MVLSFSYWSLKAALPGGSYGFLTLGLDTRHHYHHDHHRRFQLLRTFRVCASVWFEQSLLVGTMRHGLKPYFPLITTHNLAPPQAFSPGSTAGLTSPRPCHISCGVPDSCSCQSCDSDSVIRQGTDARHHELVHWISLLVTWICSIQNFEGIDW